MPDAHERLANLSQDTCDTPVRPSCGCSLHREYSRGIAKDCSNLRSLAAFFENVIVDCVYSLQRFAGDF
jgi:hypothetical protein